MRSIYTHSATQATRPASHTSSAKHRAAFARDAVFAEFRPRAAAAIDYDGFVDRRPDQGVRHIGEVAANVVDDAGRRAIAHWLKKACQAKVEEREAALEIARNIARAAGVTHADLIGREAA